MLSLAFLKNCVVKKVDGENGAAIGYRPMDSTRRNASVLAGQFSLANSRWPVGSPAHRKRLAVSGPVASEGEWDTVSHFQWSGKNVRRSQESAGAASGNQPVTGEGEQVGWHQAVQGFTKSARFWPGRL